MAIGNRLNHDLVIERATAGARDPDATRGVPALTWATLATVRGSVQPKSAREIAQLNQAGAVPGDYTIFLLPTDVAPADRLRDADTGCSFAGLTFQLTGVRDPAGVRHHLELDADLVQP